MKILIVVDMQNDFINGSLGTTEAQAIIPRIKTKIENYIADGGFVVFTQDTHGDDYLETQEGTNLPINHCIVGSYGWNIHSSLKKYTVGRCIYRKDTFGCKLLARDLDRNWCGGVHITEIEIVGLCTDICVISNALLVKAFLPETKVTVDASCCAGVTPDNHDNALSAMKMCQINVIGEE